MATFKTLRTLDLATIRFGNSTFTHKQFDKFIQELKDANFDVVTFSTLQRYKYIVGKQTKVITNVTYTPTEFADFVNELMGDDLYDMREFYEWNAEKQVFERYEYKTVYYINY